MNTSNALSIITPNHPALQPLANPVAVSLASIGPRSRRAMNQALRVIAEILGGPEADPASLPWWKVEYQHSQAIRSARPTIVRVKAASSSAILGQWRWVDLACPTTRQALRSDTPSCRVALSTNCLRREGLRSFPVRLPLKSICPRSGQLRPSSAGYSPFPIP